MRSILFVLDALIANLHILHILCSEFIKILSRPVLFSQFYRWRNQNSEHSRYSANKNMREDSNPSLFDTKGRASFLTGWIFKKIRPNFSIIKECHSSLAKQTSSLDDEKIKNLKYGLWHGQQSDHQDLCFLFMM